MPVGVVVRRAPGVTRWAKWSWKAVAVLPGAADADWSVLRQDGDYVEFHAASPTLELHSSETEAYLHGLAAQTPCVYVVMREEGEEPEKPFTVILITASPYEAQDYSDSSDEVVEKVPMTDTLHAWITDFVAENHEEEVFIKRRRDKKRTDLKEDGVGDARISQLSDVYRAPGSRSKERLH